MKGTTWRRANRFSPEEYQRELRSKTTLKLISKREKRGHNSWMHNTPALGGKAHTTNRLYMHPDDASEAGLQEGDLAEIGTEHGSVQALSGKTWTGPVLAHGVLYLRSHSEMVAYDLRPGGSS